MGLITLGVVADTHIPDRVARLHPRLLTLFQKRHVDAILHAGDICTPAVLEELETVAPVHAVRGNRDIYYLRHLPARRELVFNGISIGLIHGHGNLRNYLVDRLRYMVRGLQIHEFQERVLRSFPHSQIIVYGHIHHAVRQWIGEQLVFNPGSACCSDHANQHPTAGLIVLGNSGEIQGEIIPLD